MHEIKFMGKRVDNKEWIYGYYVAAEDKHYIFTGETGTFQVDPVHPHLAYKELLRHAVDPETVGQYTGLKDEEGKEIYEGDIVKFGSQMGSTGDIRYLNKNAGFLIKDKWGDWQWLYDVLASTRNEILGNIYDNRELTEGGTR
jgi:uncharacterized phage protein (TIGR01671 family)